MEYWKTFVERCKLKKQMGTQTYMDMLKHTRGFFCSSDKYKEDCNIKSLLGYMKGMKRNVYAAKWFECLGVIMAIVGHLRLEDYPDGQMITTMCVGVAGSIVAHIVKKNIQKTYKACKEDLMLEMTNIGVDEEMKQRGVDDKSLNTCKEDLCDTMVDLHREMNFGME